MAKTIMISDEAYNKLSTLKKDMSFSKTIISLIEISAEKIGAGLFSSYGILKEEDNEYGQINAVWHD